MLKPHCGGNVINSLKKKFFPQCPPCYNMTFPQEVTHGMWLCCSVLLQRFATQNNAPRFTYSLCCLDLNKSLVLEIHTENRINTQIRSVPGCDAGKVSDSTQHAVKI